MAQSKLTSLSNKRSASELQMMSRKSINWLNTQVSTLRNPSSRIPSTIKAESHRGIMQIQGESMLGKLYFFYYDPKTKEKLPYYDRFPLVLALNDYNDGFLGLNLHYLPIKVRMAFMLKLIGAVPIEMGGESKKSAKDREIEKLHITYNILKTAQNLKEFRPCIKRYLYSQIGSKILTVQPNEWDTAIMLPVQQFKKAKSAEVWADSVNEIKDSNKTFGSIS